MSSRLPAPSGEATMPDFPGFSLQMPVLGNTWALGAVFQLHLVIVAFIIGIAIVAPVAEYLGTRPGGENWDWLARLLSATVIRFFAFGATWAVFALVLLFGLYPRLFGVLSSVFFWPLLFVAAIWFVMSVSAYLYSETWSRLAGRKGWHIAIGAVFAIFTFAFITIITGLSSFQLTPPPAGGGGPPYANATWLPETVHRHVGNLSYAGLVLAGYSALRVLTSRPDSLQRARYDWAGHLGLVMGVGFGLVQPIAGWFYASQTQTGAPEAYQRMMIGENAWMFLVQTFLLGALLFLGNLYFSRAIHRGQPGARAAVWTGRSLWLIALLALLAIIPKEWPLGQMTPWKYLSLAGLALLSVANLAIYLRNRHTFVWGRAGRDSQAALVALGIVAVALMVTMGVIRESARGSDLIYKRLGPGQSQDIQAP